VVLGGATGCPILACCMRSCAFFHDAVGCMLHGWPSSPNTLLAVDECLAAREKASHSAAQRWPSMHSAQGQVQQGRRCCGGRGGRGRRRRARAPGAAAAARQAARRAVRAAVVLRRAWLPCVLRRVARLQRRRPLVRPGVRLLVGLARVRRARRVAARRQRGRALLRGRLRRAGRGERRRAGAAGRRGARGRAAGGAVRRVWRHAVGGAAARAGAVAAGVAGRQRGARACALGAARRAAAVLSAGHCAWGARLY